MSSKLYMFGLTPQTRYWASLSVAAIGVMAANARLSGFFQPDCASLDPTRYLLGICVSEFFQPSEPRVSVGFVSFVAFANACFFVQPVLSIFLLTSNIMRLAMMTIYAGFVAWLAPLGAPHSASDSMSGVVVGWGLILLFGVPNIGFTIYRLSRATNRQSDSTMNGLDLPLSDRDAQ